LPAVQGSRIQRRMCTAKSEMFCGRRTCYAQGQQRGSVNTLSTVHLTVYRTVTIINYNN